MKKHWKKLVLLIMTLGIFFPVKAFAADSTTITDSTGEWEYVLEDSGLIITAYKGTSTNVVIPDTLDDLRVSQIGSQAFYNNHTMRVVTIPAGITYIGAEAFRGCIALNTINFNAKNCTFPDVWIYDGKRGVGVFSGAGSAATSLTVNFGAGIKKVPDRMFYTASIGEYGIQGSDYAHVTSVVFSSSITEIGQLAFRNCDELETLTLGSAITVVRANAFNDCDALTTLTLSENLQTLEDSAFRSCDSLESITWGSSMDVIGPHAFRDCISLKKAIIPEPTSEIGIDAFAGCSVMTEISLPRTLTYLRGEAFINTTKLNKITFDCANVDVADVWIYDGNRGIGVFSGAGASSNGLAVTFGSNVTKVPDRLFYTASIGEYGLQGSDYAHVTSATFSSTVTTIGERAFRNCDSLRSLSFGSGVTTINENAFNDCDLLGSVTFDNKLQTIGNNAFYSCDNLSSISWGTGLDSIGARAFDGCKSLTTISVPSPTTSIGTGAFANCTEVTKVVLPSSLNQLGGEAFAGTSKLANLEINSVNLTVPDVWIYDGNRGIGAFSGAGSGVNKLTVTFGSNVTSIPANIFFTASTDVYGQTGSDFAHITDVYFTGKVTTMGTNAFRSCQSLATVYFNGTQKEWNACINTGAGNEALLNVTLHCNQWKKVSGKWYFVNYLGENLKNWQKADGSWFYLGSDGVMRTGWQKISGKWYYFSSGGAMQTGWLKLDNKWYYFNSSGAMLTGWQKLSNKWYYFESSGAMATGWKTISGKTYFFKSSGVMAANEWCNGWWLNKDGTWTYQYKASWKKNAKGWWYGDTSGWYAKNTTITIDGKSYTFDASGYML